MHPLSNQEILFTRQRHEADKMGLHWDYRFVLGDKAYSWATKKEMPELGKSILLFEQPIHDREYALSQTVKIPPGNYGAGTTTLDWVHKAQVDGYDDEPGKLIIKTKDGKQRFLLKKLDKGTYFDTYGDKAWLFRNLGPEYREGPNSTFTHDGKTGTVDSLLDATKNVTPILTSVSDLSWILPYTTIDQRRVERADVSVPVIATKYRGKLAVIDGGHRLAKAVRDNLKSLPVKMLPEQTLPAMQKTAALKAKIRDMCTTTRLSAADLGPILGTEPLSISDVSNKIQPLHNYDPTSFLASRGIPSKAGLLTKFANTMNNKYLTKIAEQKDKRNFGTKALHAWTGLTAGGIISAPITLASRGLANKVINDVHVPDSSMADRYTVKHFVRSSNLSGEVKFQTKNKNHIPSYLANSLGPAAVPKHELGNINHTIIGLHGKGINHSVTMHELGHIKDFHKNLGLHKMLVRAGPVAGLASVAALTNEKTENYSPALALAGGVGTLRAEGMANYHAYKGIHAHKGAAAANKFVRKFLPAQMGNYTLVKAVVPAVASGVALKVVKTLRERYNQRKQDK